MSAAKAKLKLPVVKDPRLEDILLWRDPKKTAVCLAGSTGVYGLLTVIAANPVVVLANLLQLAVIVAFLWNSIANLLKRPGVPVPAFIKEGLSEADAKEKAVRWASYYNKALAAVDRVLSGKDVLLSLQIAGGLFVVSRVAAFVSPLTLAYFGVLALFTLPKVYELRKDEIDGHLTKVKDGYNTVYNKHVQPALKRIPRASTATTSSATTTTKSAAPAVSEAISKPTPAAVNDVAGNVASEVQSLMEGFPGQKRL